VDRCNLLSALYAVWHRLRCVARYGICPAEKSVIGLIKHQRNWSSVHLVICSLRVTALIVGMAVGCRSITPHVRERGFGRWADAALSLEKTLN